MPELNGGSPPYQLFDQGKLLNLSVSCFPDVENKDSDIPYLGRALQALNQSIHTYCSKYHLTPSECWVNVRSDYSFNCYYLYNLRQHPFLSSYSSMHFYIVELWAMNLIYFPTKQINYFSKSLNIINIQTRNIFRDNHPGPETIWTLVSLTLPSMNLFKNYPFCLGEKNGFFGGWEDVCSCAHRWDMGKKSYNGRSVN